MFDYLMFILFYLLLLSTIVFGTFEFVPNQRMNPMLMIIMHTTNASRNQVMMGTLVIDAFIIKRKVSNVIQVVP